MHVATPGGGGYGNPLERPAEAVLEDVRLGRYSVAEAKSLYGVMITGMPAAPQIDHQATEQLRAKRAG